MTRFGDSDARDATRRVRARSSKERAAHLSRVVLIRNLPLHASGSRRAQAVVSRLRLTGSRCGNASQSQRNRHPLVPACSGARAPLACEDRNTRRVCSCVVTGCRSRQATPRFRKACSHWQTRHVDGNLAFDDPQGSLLAKEALRGGLTAAKP